MTTIRALLLFEGATFLTAALVHFGVLAGGYQHREAAIAETVIGAVLLLGWAVTVLRPVRARAAGLAVQTFALAGTLVGATMIAVGVGPQTTPDLVYHAFLLVLLLAGFVLFARTRRLAVP